jgi:hypothetical protein
MPTHSSWRGAVAALREVTRTVTSQQLKLAAHVGIQLPKALPQLVAASRLRMALASELGFSKHPSSDYQLDFLASLNGTRARNPLAQADQQEAAAWIAFYLLKRRRQDLSRLRLEAGDIIEITDGNERLEEVVSIGSDGRLHFKGGHGAGAWPDQVTVRCRKGTNTPEAEDDRRLAANRAARRSRIDGLSMANEQALAEFKVTATLTWDDVDKLQEVIDTAPDEKPIQQFLERHPQLLTALLTGQYRFFIPRPSLGGKYFPDVLLCDFDSLGVRWLLIELETPVSNVTVQNDNVLEKHARKGMSQIEEWREWILNNLNLARRSKREGGVGLVGIRPLSQGIVLVGRRESLKDNNEMVRSPIREGNNIHVHSYDWLIERLQGTLTFRGSSAGNPYLIQPLRDNRNE